MIFVMATIQVAERRRDDFLAALNNNVPKVCAENGCVQYVPAIDVETNIDAQPDTRQNVVTVVEQWESLEALRAHLSACPSSSRSRSDTCRSLQRPGNRAGSPSHESCPTPRHMGRRSLLYLAFLIRGR